LDQNQQGARAADTSSVTRVSGIVDFWDRIDSANVIVLMLDYDGTLAPFHVDRMKAHPLPRVVDALHEIDSDTRSSIVIVSGRPVAEIVTLLGDHGFTIAGSHGYEVYTPTEGLVPMHVSTRQTEILDAAFSQAMRVFDPARIERKPASVAIHFRGLDAEDYVGIERELARDWQAMTEDEATELRPFNGGLELRAVGRSKGAIVTETLANSPDGALAIYIGDDDTDEDAFAALPDDGIGIKVGPEHAESLAEGRLPDCVAVEQLLVDWGARRWRS
jgi:trehalose 6-phosphate phosphatase